MSVAPHPPLRLSEPVTVDPSATPVDHVRASLDQRLRALLTHEPGTRTGEDIEDLHQMRVAVRRMRATLKAARSKCGASVVPASESAMRRTSFAVVMCGSPIGAPSLRTRGTPYFWK